ncbi:MAG: SBBP repeat-containing protein, partial [Acidobacteria bacterium]|nr:SBBP repeat-containing protein [Acidobacteriota bacterium]
MSKTFRPFALAVAVACVSGTALTYRLFHAPPQAAIPASRPATAAAPPVPLWFERNTGEYPAQVLYASRSLRQTVYLTPSQMTVAAPSGEAVGISWTNAKPARVIEGRKPSAARVDYFRGKDRSQWRTGAQTPRYGEVRYEQIYNGVDLVFHPQVDKLEHDFVVAPGADPAQIGLRFNGAASVQLATDGSLAIRTASGSEIRQTKPVAYQNIDGERVEVAATYRITGEASAEFALGAYDTSKELVIDPVLDYSTYLNSSGFTSAVSVIAEPGTSFVWVAGTTNALDFPVAGAPNAPIRETNLGLRDIFIAKLDTSKFGTESLVYAGFVGGSGADEAYAMTLDNEGNAVIVGSTASFDFPIVGSMDSEIEGANDAVILKIDPRREGGDALMYTTFLGGDGLDYATAVATDSTGRINVSGYTVSENFPLTANAIQRNRQHGYELFISRVDPNAGTSGLQYSTYYGGSNTDIARAVAVDPKGRILVAGSTSSDNFPIGNEPLQATYHGAGDMFLIRVDPEKSGLDGIDYGTFIGGGGIDSAEAIHLDAEG